MMAEEQQTWLVSQLRQEMQTQSQQLQEVHGKLREFLIEQRYIKEDMNDIQTSIRGINQVLTEGNLPISTRLVMVERDVETLKTGQFRVRDFWLKVLAPIIVAGIVFVMGLIGMVYVMTKGGVVKP